MGKYRVSIKGKNYEAMADLVRRHFLSIAGHSVKKLARGAYSVQAFADGPQIKTLERAGSDRPGIYFLGGIHAREWGSADILINFVQQLTNAYRSQQGIAVGRKKFTAGQNPKHRESQEYLCVSSGQSRWPVPQHELRSRLAKEPPAGATFIRRRRFAT
jgi:hypothetical protein